MPTPRNPNLLQELLDPLVEDFAYWFDRSLKLLENNRIEFLSQDEQDDLRDRVRQASAELTSANQLYKLTGNEVGIDPNLVMKWHRLLVECGSVGRRFRQLQALKLDSDSPESLSS